MTTNNNSEKQDLKSKFRDAIKCEFLTTEEVSQFLGLPISTIRTWAWSRPEYLPYIKMGRKNMYRVSDIIEFLDESSSRNYNEPKRGRKRKGDK